METILQLLFLIISQLPPSTNVACTAYVDQNGQEMTVQVKRCQHNNYVRLNDQGRLVVCCIDPDGTEYPPIWP